MLRMRCATTVWATLAAISDASTVSCCRSISLSFRNRATKYVNGKVELRFRQTSERRQLLEKSEHRALLQRLGIRDHVAEG